MRFIPLIILLISLSKCANVIPPEGGPRDTIPPILIKSSPSNNSKNFNGQKITLEFSELIQLKNAKEEVIITPSMGKDTKFTYKKNIATIEPGNKLDSSTTYSISFREVIQDLNEGNPSEGLKLAFSTGEIIDSLQIFGSVYSLLEGRPLEKFNIAIYTSDTVDITRHPPSYISRSDKKGRFSVTNLKPGDYYIYAWEDKNKNLKVETNSERFGTITHKIKLPGTTDSVRIPVVKLDSRPLKLNSYRNISNYSIIRLNKAPVNYKITSAYHIRTHYSTSNTEIIAYPPVSFPDSIQIRFEATDSLRNKIDSTFYIKQTKAKPIKENFEVKINFARYTAPYKLLEAEINYSLPIKYLIPDSIHVMLDTVYFEKFSKGEISLDTISRKMYLKKTITIPDTLLTKSPNLTIKKGAIYSIFKDTLKTLTQRIIPKIEKDLATVIITSKQKKENWTIEAVDERYNILQQQGHNKTTTFKYLDPINTKFRAYHDVNKNGLWDINDPLKKIEPEQYIYYKNEKGQDSTPLRANWTVEITWDF